MPRFRPRLESIRVLKFIVVVENIERMIDRVFGPPLEALLSPLVRDVAINRIRAALGDFIHQTAVIHPIQHVANRVEKRGVDESFGLLQIKPFRGALKFFAGHFGHPENLMS